MAPFGSKNMASALNSRDNLAILKSLWFDIKVATILLLHPCTADAPLSSGESKGE
jgi:hypothetical protein